MAEPLTEERLRHNLFASWSFGLRFELSGSGSYVQMFTRALERTLVLMRFALVDVGPIEVVVRCYHGDTPTSMMPKSLHDLTECGFRLPDDFVRREHTFKEEYRVTDQETFITEIRERTKYEYTYRFPARWEDANTMALVWAILGGELGIQPRAAVGAYFIAQESGLVVHPYDDRGIDMVSDAPGMLPAISQRFPDWLMGCRPEGLVPRLTTT
jgi:Domain of unknown function (DUF3885)